MYPDLGWLEDKAGLGIVSDKLLEVKQAKRTGKNCHIHFSSIDVPLFNNENSYGSLYFPDLGYRLLALFRYWNVIQYFYLYRYLLENE